MLLTAACGGGLYRVQRDASGLARHYTQAVQQFQRLSAAPVPALPLPAFPSRAVAQPSLAKE
jgi:hypothetical protein